MEYNTYAYQQLGKGRSNEKGSLSEPRVLCQTLRWAWPTRCFIPTRSQALSTLMKAPKPKGSQAESSPPVQSNLKPPSRNRHVPNEAEIAAIGPPETPE
ncbi:hypothetical protein LA080_001723 [Diaporthe eres]|nr:hypothetical protein LA080_001723 [Diaporthe eres]